MNNISVNPRFQSLIPPLAEAERAALEASLLVEGCRDALVLWNNILVDGHNRLEICQQHDLPYATVHRDFASEDEAAIWIIRNQLARRNLPTYERARLALQLEPLVAEQAKARQVIAWQAAIARKGEDGKFGSEEPMVQISAPSGQANPCDGTVPQKSAEPIFEPTKTRNVIAQAAGVSHDTIAKVKLIEAKATPEVKAALRSGEVSINQAHKHIAQDEKKQQIKAKQQALKARETSPPSGKFDVIVIDPPWPMEKIERDVAPNQVAFDYPTMTEEELKALQIPYNDDCHIWLWTTHKFLPMALRLLERWGLKYVCTFVWHKPGGFQPFGLPQYNAEFALYARKGAPTFVDTKAFNVCFEAPRGGHSEKPDHFYEMICRVTNGHRLDMFNRRKIEGFFGWGNEAV